MSGRITTAFLSDPQVVPEIELITERPRTNPNNRSRSSSTCTLGRYDEGSFQEIAPDEVVDLTIDDSSTSHQTLRGGEYALASWRAGHDIIRPEDCIEVRGISLGIYDIHFVVVKIIARAHTGNITLRGIPLTRTRGLAGKLPKKPNEVCRILHLDNGDNDQIPALVEVPTKSVIKKRSLIVTNALYPEYCCQDFRSMRDDSERNQAKELHGTLVCRWSFKIFSVKQRTKSKPVEEVLERIHVSEVHQVQYRKSDESLSYQWRGGRILGGSWSEKHPSRPPTIDLESSEPQLQARPRLRQQGQKYTLFDSFSGAGGASRGAQMANFKVTHAVDKAEEVWPTYRTNFPSTRLFKNSVDEFIKNHKHHIRADILHLSPPCQYFSPAHTHQGVNDDENIFALFSCNSLINKVRPRIITVEQTFGITHERHQEYLRILINDFTQFGYSVRWKVVRLCTWGSAQDRKRLIMIAAAPGENIPPFPRPTHSEGGVGGLKPYTTIHRALSGIRPGDDLHDLATVKRYQPRKAVYNPNRLAGTLTTGGADFAYPDGSRDFTLREYANLQGFPRYHKFQGTRTSIKRQIGNAFPPNTVKVLYQHLERWLLNQDGMLPCQPRIVDAIMVDIQDDPIIVDDSDESSVCQRSSSSEGRHESPTMDDVVEILDPMDIDGGQRHHQCVNNTCNEVMIDLT